MDNTKKSNEEQIAELEKKIKHYEEKLGGTLDQIERSKWAGKIDNARKEIKKLSEKKLTPKVKKRIEDPVIAEKANSLQENDGRGSVINTGNGTFNFIL